VTHFLSLSTVFFILVRPNIKVCDLGKMSNIIKIYDGLEIDNESF
jgi:hypothetical protein